MAVIIASVAGITVPASYALTQRDYNYLNDNHLTARYGNTQVCGDHLCAPGEWDKLQAQLTSAQLGNQAGRNAGQTTTTPSTTTTPTTPTSAPPSVCDAIKNILEGAGMSSTVTAKVMSDLGC